MKKLADSNVWLALTLSKHSFHEAARIWLGQMTSDDTLLFCRATQQSYLRLLTTAQVLAPYGIPPRTNSQAWVLYDQWLAIEGVEMVGEPGGIEQRWTSLTSIHTSSPKLWMDAYLAALAITAGYQLVTTDQGFKQFKGLDLQLVTR